MIIWVCDRCNHRLSGNPRFCPQCGYTVYRPAFPEPCCDSHNRHCEPPAELCCRDCTEAAHDTFPVRHADGSRCVLNRPEEYR